MKRFTFFLLLCFVSSGLMAQSAIQVEKSGSGDVILFLPGFTTPGSVWAETINHLEGDYESHTATYAGFGGLEPIEMPWYSSVKTDLLNYIKENNLKKVTLVGHSMGGNLAIDIASTLPKHIHKVLIVDGIPCMREVMMPGVPASMITYESPFSAQMLAMEDDAFAQMATGMAANMSNNTEKTEDIVNWVLTSDRETYVYGYTDLLKLDQREQLKDITAETLILMAPFPDEDMVRNNYEQQYENLESKKLLMANDSKHFIMLDQPEWFYHTLNSFLK